MASIEETREQAEAAARGGLPGRILEVVSRSGTHVVFGEPVERDGCTVVTVARTRYGFGWGAGGAAGAGGARPAESGDGAGGGVMADPVGFIEIGASGAAFRPIRDERPSAAFMLMTGLGAWLILSGFARIMRALRR